ncbi:Aste57867_20024 [Aphanomyces stellatus]|uniref:Aste57867_20024 protein n=1 Tax=Aphanomyces stellatus TaxID=120398 RepID=A0A485LEL5_9STRA|nr:hypothetical protein As57867_019958 [Aphanomyces stellatus]VFT96720.1 Aste57867_20024 [Aphanomyces stellatus]
MFWPHLWLNRTFILENEAHVAAVVKLFSHVVVDGMFDLEWLRRHLALEASDAVRSLPQARDVSTPLVEWFNQWTRFRIADGLLVDIYFNRLKLTLAIDALPRLQHLIHLTSYISMQNASLRFSFATTSPTLVELNNVCTSGGIVITAAMLTNATTWLKTNPIRLFGCF